MGSEGSGKIMTEEERRDIKNAVAEGYRQGQRDASRDRAERDFEKRHSKGRDGKGCGVLPKIWLIATIVSTAILYFTDSGLDDFIACLIGGVLIAGLIVAGITKIGGWFNS